MSVNGSGIPNIPERVANIKCICINSGNTVRNSDGAKICALPEGRIPNGLYTIRNFDGGKACAFVKGTIY